MGHERPFPPPRPTGRYRFSEETFAGTRAHEHGAPKAAPGGTMLGCGSAWNKDPVFGVIGIQSGPRRQRVGFALRALDQRGDGVSAGLNGTAAVRSTRAAAALQRLGFKQVVNRGPESAW